MSEIIAKRYEIIKTLGQGGMANVYLALDRILNREVAIKILKSDMSSDPVSLERFSREAHASARISHPNIVDIYDVGNDGDKHFIVMEYVKGYTLKQLIKRRGAIPPREAVWMIKQLASALMEAHKHGLIHRDVKSQNVLIKADGTIKLADFGIAVLNNSMQLTSKDSVLGSVHYLAPELAKGGSASMQSDIYSLGIVFYELLTGDVPFKGDTPVQVALKHVKEPLPDVKKFNPQIPQSVVNVLLCATAKDPQERYANVALMLRDLNTCLDKTRINEAPVKLQSNTKSNFSDYNISATSNDVKKKDIQKTENRISKLIIVSISLLSILALTAILFISGVFSTNSSKLVKVPDVVGLTQASAADAIDAAGLQVEYPVIRELTDNTEAGIVVDAVPFAGAEVEKGTKITLTVSSGLYSTMSNYVGKNIKDARIDLSNSSIKIDIIEKTTNEYSEGTIISQGGIEAGAKYDPNKNATVTFEVAYPESTNVPTQLLGKNINEAYQELLDEGFNVEIEFVVKSELDDEIVEKYKPDTVCKVDPEEGSVFIKNQNSKITLYYYTESE